MREFGYQAPLRQYLKEYTPLDTDVAWEWLELQWQVYDKRDYYDAQIAARLGSKASSINDNLIKFPGKEDGTESTREEVVIPRTPEERKRASREDVARFLPMVAGVKTVEELDEVKNLTRRQRMARARGKLDEDTR